MRSVMAEEIAWRWRGERVRIGVTRLGAGPAVLLLPALSSISRRHEMRPLQERLADRFSAVALDWPGFGDLPRPALAWSPDVCDAFLAHALAEVVPAPCATVAAGHAAGFALRRAAATPGSAGRLCLVAPTWRGPLPTMAGRRHPSFARIAAVGDWPVVGGALYRLNVNRPVMNMMVRGHVYADPGWLDEARTAEKLAVIRAPGARHASIRFVTGQLDPFADRAGFLAAARRAIGSTPVLVVRGADTPPKSRAEMEALASVAGVREAVLPRGKLSVHEEFAEETAAAVGGFLDGTDEPGSAPSEAAQTRAPTEPDGKP
jgi:pimeloyl-ACP methyl ester carboxylesterase